MVEALADYPNDDFAQSAIRYYSKNIEYMKLAEPIRRSMVNAILGNLDESSTTPKKNEKKSKYKSASKTKK